MTISDDSLFRAITSSNINDVTTYNPDADNSLFNYLTLGIRSFYKKSHANQKKNEYARLTQLIIEQFSHDATVKKISVTLNNTVLTLSQTDAGYVEMTTGNEKQILDMTLGKLVTRMKVDRVVHAASYGIPENERQSLASIDLKSANLNAMDLSGANLSYLDLTLATLTGAQLTGVTLTDTILIRADLSELDLSGLSLSGANLTGANLTRAKLNGANLAGAVLTGIILTGANLTATVLTGMDLRGAKLNGANLSGLDLSGTNLAGANLTETILTGAKLTGTNLAMANLSGLDLSGQDLSGANLTGAILTGAKLTGTNLTGTTLTRAILMVANLSGLDLSGQDLSGANLRGAILAGAKLSGAKLTGANLRGAILAGIDLTAVNLSGLDFTGTNLSGANLSGVDLTGTILTGANLSGANLTGANLSGLDLTGTIFTGATLTGANLSGLDFTRYPQLKTAVITMLLNRAMPELTILGNYACTDAPSFTTSANPDYAKIMDKYNLFHKTPERIDADKKANSKVTGIEITARRNGISCNDLATVAGHVAVAKAGCCSTLAFAAAHALMQHNQHNLRIEVVARFAQHNRTHYFVIIGRAAGSNIASPSTWGMDARVVDPWSMTLGGPLLGDAINAPTNIWPPNKSLFDSAIPSGTPLKPAGALGDISSVEHWQWSETDLQKLSAEIKEKLKTADTQEDADESRWVVQLDGDDITVDAVKALIKKHPRNSELIQSPSDFASEMNRSLKWDYQRQMLVWSALSPPQRRLKILLVGHGTYHGEEGAATFGSRSSDLLKNDLRKLLSGITPGSTQQIDITLVGCRLGADTSHESLPQQLADLLLQRGRELFINADNLRLSAYQYDIKVMPDGKKSIYIPAEGWITRQEAIAANEQYKFAWRYDSTTERMVCEVNTARLMDQVDRLFYRKVLFHELSFYEKQLVLRVLQPQEINALSQQNEDGRVLHKALQEMAVKFTDSAQGVIDGNKALHQILDSDAAALDELAHKVGLSGDIDADKRAGEQVLRVMQQSVDADVTVPADSYTQRSLGRRARLVKKVQTFLGHASNTILGLGSIAAICRLKVINYRLNNEKLSAEERAKLRSEEALTIAELGADFSDEINSLIYGRVSAKPAGNTVKSLNPPASSSQAARLTLGKRIAGGLRSFNATSALKAVGTLLSVVGTGLAWYGVHTAIQELKELTEMPGADTDAELKNRITQLRVNLGVNIATAIISSLLTGAAVVNLIGSAGAAFSVAIMASVAKITATFLSVAGPIGGAILAGAFIGLWIYNGIKTVQQFSQHMELSGWDEFQLGVGSLVGYVPEYLQQEYDLNKLKAALKKVVQLEITGVFLSHPDVKTVHHPFLPEIVYNNIAHEESIDSRLYLLSPGAALFTELAMLIFRKPLTPVASGYRALDINMNTQSYLALSSSEGSLEESARNIDPSEFIHARKTYYQVQDIAVSPEVSGTFVKTGLAMEGRVTGEITSGTRLNAAIGQWLADDTRDNLRVQLPDNRVVMLKGKEKSLTPVTSPDEKQAVAPPVTTSTGFNSGVFVNETDYLTLFCLDPGTRIISFFKYRKQHDGSYQLDVSFSQILPTKFTLPQNTESSGIFFQDLDGDGLADLVVVNEDGSLQVARQKRDGTFIHTEEFSLYRAKDARGNPENLSFSGQKILGFCGTKRTLYSKDSSKQEVYAYTVVSSAERDYQVTWVNLNIAATLPEDKKDRVDRFVASSSTSAGHFMFRLGGGRRKIVTGGVNNDSFFVLDSKTYCTLHGNAGSNTLNFSELDTKNSGWGVTVANNMVSHNYHVFVSFSNIKNFVGTSVRDDINGDDDDNVIDGVSGTDIINGGKGNDVIKGVNGIFAGGLGIDSYELRRETASGVNSVLLVEDYSLGEDSHVSLDYRSDEIAYMVPYVDEGKTHLRIGLKTGRQYTLHNFYSNEHASEGQASAWHITTADGFRFRLQTAAALPADMARTGSPVSGIPVFFQGTMREEERAQASVNFYAGDENTAGDRVEITEIVAGHEKKREIRLPSPLFTLALHHCGMRGVITGSRRSERLTGAGGVTLKGNGGADSYVIEQFPGGVVRVDNHDDAPLPLQDTLILPWALSRTALSVEGSDIVLSSTGNSENQVKVCLVDFISNVKSRHLAVRGSFGESYQLDITAGGVAYLASGALALDKQDRLVLLSASQGGLNLDGRGRDLSVSSQLTVLVDSSGKGNKLYGTENARNYLQAFAGDNHLYGGSLADELHGGTGNNHMAGKGGDDAYYVERSATILDTGGEDRLILEAATGTAQEELWFDRTIEDNLRIRFRSDRSRTIIVQGYYASPAQKIEHIAMNGVWLSGTDIDNMVIAMSMVQEFADQMTMRSNSVLADALGRWSTMIAVSAA